MTAPNRRRSFVADGKVLFSYKLVWLLAIVNLALFGVFAYTALPAMMSGDASQIGLGNLYLLGLVTTLLTLSCVGLAIYSVVQWHRLLGAAYRIQTSIREVHTAFRNDEKWTAVRLREGDQLVPLAEEVNELVSALAAGEQS